MPGRPRSGERALESHGRSGSMRPDRREARGGTSCQRTASGRSLPIPDRAYSGFVAYDAKNPDSSFPAIEPLRPPAGAPNVLVVLLDDVGFGASSSFGGPVSMPTAERLATGGLKYTRFHTTALCSPTRQALLTGRVHRRRGPPVLPGDLPGHRPGGAQQDARRGLPLHGGHDRQGHPVDPPAEGADGRQAVLRLPRARRDPRPPPRAHRVGRQVQGEVRPGLGPAPGGDHRAAEGARRDPCRRRADRPPQGDPGLGRDARGAEAGADPPDEVYAGFLEFADHHVGRLVDALQDLEVLGDTLVYYIVGDNGASAEGTPSTAPSTR
jgi:hypothetical protein